MTPSQPQKIENIIQKEEKDWEKEQKNTKWLNLHHPKQDLISLPANSISSSHISNSLSQPLPFFYFSLYFHNKSKLLKIYIWLENKITLKKHKNKDSFISSYREKIETDVSWSLTSCPTITTHFVFTVSYSLHSSSSSSRLPGSFYLSHSVVDSGMPFLNTQIELSFETVTTYNLLFFLFSLSYESLDFLPSIH